MISRYGSETGMNQVRKLTLGGTAEAEGEARLQRPPQPSEESLDAHLGQVLRLIGPFEELSAPVPPTRRSSPQEWSSLIERVRSAASHVRDVEAQAHEQELRVQDLLERVRVDIKKANDRVQAAETRTQEVQARAEALVRAADERAQAAEERARIAEEWLARVYETINTEFTLDPASKITP